jgi:hypothetical protein
MQVGRGPGSEWGYVALMVLRAELVVGAKASGLWLYYGYDGAMYQQVASGQILYRKARYIT